MEKQSAIEKMLAVSLGFTMMLLAFRMAYAMNLNYIFYVWNLFLAVLPILISRKLRSHDRLTKKVIMLLIVWLLLLPNAPYVVTDLLHYKERWPVPKWYDLLLVTSAAWNGLMAGFISVMQVEHFLSKFLTKRKTGLIIFIVFFLCGYGIYIGRFLRFNSWDVITDPLQLFSASARHFILPYEYLAVWKFTVLFALMLVIIYHSLKQFSFVEQQTLKEN
jgi:uncharacterized membrane protein